MCQEGFVRINGDRINGLFHRSSLILTNPSRDIRSTGRGWLEWVSGLVGVGERVRGGVGGVGSFCLAERFGCWRLTETCGVFDVPVLW